MCIVAKQFLELEHDVLNQTLNFFEIHFAFQVVVLSCFCLAFMCEHGTMSRKFLAFLFLKKCFFAFK